MKRAAPAGNAPGVTLDRLAAVVRRGVAFVVRAQRPDGGFVSFTSPRPDAFAGAASRRTTFAASNTLAALCAVDEALAGSADTVRLAGVRQRTAAFLLRQKSADWSFNYWVRGSGRYRTQPYPDDLDDTFCAVAALWLAEHAGTPAGGTRRPDAAGSPVIDGAALAALAHVLMAAEQQPGGPYRTWLAAPSLGAAWRDVDLAVNANVGYFLYLQEVTVPGVTALAEAAIRNGAYASRYYPGQAAPLYFIARWYRGGLHGQLAQHGAERLAAADDPLSIALLASSLLRLGRDAAAVEPAVQRLLRMQQPDGGWPAQAFCLDPAVDGVTYYAGAPALTTAFCLETLSLFAAARRQAAPPVGRDPLAAEYGRVVRAVRRDIAALPQPDLRRQTAATLRLMLGRDKDRQIVLLPWLTARAAAPVLRSGAQPAPADLRCLATASLWGWMAYTVYDDFLDAGGDPLRLPAANLCLRRLVVTLRGTLPANTAFQQEAAAILDRLDAANTWELVHCRGRLRGGRLYLKWLPDYGDHWQLADRSLGHTIAGLGTLYAAGLPHDAPALPALRDFFRHYLIARQLNDDAHDWEEDLRHGHVNAAGARILARWLEQPGHTLRGGVALDAERETLRGIMWDEVIGEICTLIARHVAAARQALAAVPFNAGPLDTLLRPSERAARQALAKRQAAADFIANL